MMINGSGSGLKFMDHERNRQDYYGSAAICTVVHRAVKTTKIDLYFTKHTTRPQYRQAQQH